MWEVLSEIDIFRADPWIHLRQERVKLPDGRIVDDYFQLTLPDFTVIYAMTVDGKVVVIHQYKHGARQVSLTLPGGLAETGENSLIAAKRELCEETGYGGGEWTHLGSFVAHGNLGCGMGHYYFTRNVTVTSQPDSGDLESMSIHLMAPEQLIQALRSGHVKLLNHAAAISMADLLRQNDVS